MENADMYRSTEGLIRKNYICDIENSLAGSIYCFETRVSAEKWFDDERIECVLQKQEEHRFIARLALALVKRRVGGHTARQTLGDFRRTHVHDGQARDRCLDHIRLRLLHLRGRRAIHPQHRHRAASRHGLRL